MLDNHLTYISNELAGNRPGLAAGRRRDKGYLVRDYFGYHFDLWWIADIGWKQSWAHQSAGESFCVHHTLPTEYCRERPNGGIQPPTSCAERHRAPSAPTSHEQPTATAIDEEYTPQTRPTNITRTSIGG